MFTKNYYIGMIANARSSWSCEAKAGLATRIVLMNGTTLSDVGTYYNEDIGIVNFYYFIPNLKNSTVSATTSVYGTILGDGTADESFDDYCLSGNQITTFDFTYTLAETMTETGYDLTAVYTITNTGDTRFTVGEVGLVSDGLVWYTQDSTSSTYKRNRNYLVNRTKLESPITIEAGGVGQVTVTYSMNYPTTVS